jgi:TonB family protein
VQAVIGADGLVSDVVVLSCSRPGIGFEEQAAAAVRQWRYKPATRNGRPVAVYFSIYVTFELR